MPEKPMMDKMCELLKNMNLYNEGDDQEEAIRRWRMMSKDDLDIHMSRMKMKRTQDAAKENGPHEESWWYDKKHPERLYMLEKVLGERMKDDSEMAKGDKRYIKERCWLYERYMKDIEK